MAYFCPNCGEPVKNAAKFCESCGARLRDDEPDIDYSSYTTRKTSGNVQYEQVSQKPVFEETQEPAVDPVQKYDTDPYREYQRHTYDYKGKDKANISSGYQSYGAQVEGNPDWPVRSKIAAGILAILLGGLGVHDFYLGKIWQGILSILFFWTGIPGLVGLIQGIIYLTQSDEEFGRKNKVRVDKEG
jgi:TM2 domain-containing membrane protein YozV